MDEDAVSIPDRTRAKRKSEVVDDDVEEFTAPSTSSKRPLTCVLTLLRARPGPISGGTVLNVASEEAQDRSNGDNRAPET